MGGRVRRPRRYSAGGAVLRLALVLLLLNSPPARPESFHEPFEADVDQNHVPDFWTRVIAPGYPRYNEVDFPHRPVCYDGTSSVRVVMRGGSAMLRCQRLLAVDPALRYELSGRIRTVGLDRDTAYLAVEWLDRAGVVLRTDRTEGVGGSSDWSRVELRFDDLEPEARFARLVCGVEGDDLAGEVWFDAIHWLEKIALEAVAPGHPGNVFLEGEDVRILLRAPTLLRGAYQVHARIARFDGTELPAPPPMPVEVGKDAYFEALFVPPVRETGYLDLWIEVRQGEVVRAARRVPVGIVPRLRKASNGIGEYGVVLDPFQRNLDPLLEHLAGMRLGRAKVILADRRDPPTPQPIGAPDPVERAIWALRRMGIDPIGILPSPPRIPQLDAASGGHKLKGLAPYFSLPPRMWESDLVERMRRYRAHVSRWQLGDDADFTLQEESERDQILERVENIIGQVTRYANLGLTVDPTAPASMETADNARLHFVSLVLPRTLTPSRVEEALGPVLAGTHPRPVTYTIPEYYQKDGYEGVRQQIRSLVQAALYARRAGARDYLFQPLAGVQSGLFDMGADPTPVYFAVRTLNLLLSGTGVDPRTLVQDPAIESPVFERGGERVVAVWRRDGFADLDLDLALGKDARVLDPTGRVLEAPGTPLARRVRVTDTPVFLVDLDPGLTATQLSIGFEGGRVRLQSGRQRETLRLTNGFGEPLRNVEMRVRLPDEMRGWRLELLERRLRRLAPGETWAVPVDIDLPESEGGDLHHVTVETRFETDLGDYVFAVRRRIVLASDLQLTMEGKPDPSTGFTMVGVAVRNVTDRPMDLKCYFFAEGRPVVPRLLPRLLPGTQETLRFTVSGDAAAAGKRVRVHVEEIRGASFANRSLVLE